MRVVYFGIPHLGGTYTVYRRLRSALAAHGVTLSWLGAGPDHARRAADPLWAAERPNGTVIAPEDADPKSRAARLIDHLETAADVDAVIVNVLADRVQMNAMRYLDPAVPRIMIVHNITPGTYAAAAALRDHVHATIGVSQRVRDDLVGRFGFPAERTHAILNGVEIDALPPRRAAPGGRCRLLYLGRVEDSSKGVFWLPEIMRRLDDLDVTLTVAGDGRDLPELRRRCARLGEERVSFLGAVPGEQVRAVLAEHDVLLFPSRFEGFGLSLAEAMAAGCVPVASRLAGITDDLVDDGRTGWLHPIGDTAAAADRVRALATAPDIRAAMSRAAQTEAAERFGTAVMGAAYDSLLRRTIAAPPAIAAPLPLDRWRMPRGMRDGWRGALPEPVKNILRAARESIAASRRPVMPLKEDAR